MESLKDSKFKSFEGSKINDLTKVIGGYAVQTGPGGGIQNDIGYYSNVNGGTNNDLNVTQTSAGDVMPK